MKPGATPINISAPSSDIVQLHPTLEVEDLPSIAIHSDEPTNIVIGTRDRTRRGAHRRNRKHERRRHARPLVVVVGGDDHRFADEQ